MALSRLDIHRRNRGERTLVTLAGDIGPAPTPLLRAAVEQCLLDGVTEIDIDLTTVGSCDARGLDVLLSAARRAGRVHARLRLHHPCAQIARLLDATGSTSLLLTAPVSPVPPTASSDHMSTATRGPEDPARRPDQPVLRDGIRLRRLTRRQAEDMREDIADLAAESVADTVGDGIPRPRRLPAPLGGHRPPPRLRPAGRRDDGAGRLRLRFSGGLRRLRRPAGRRNAPGDHPAAHPLRAVRRPDPGRGPSARTAP
ncbi:STAS domain-containing protein [Streptomyces thermocarboxydovorans]|uniref:STAS domain-containing protein n=1 Tax=Streptomyces thermocarboxydovorans TaxID=59298 RepID=UPI0031CDF946